MRIKRFPVVLITLALVATATGCASSSQGPEGSASEGAHATRPAELDALYDEVVESGENVVTVYASGADMLAPVSEKFTDAYGIRVDLVQMGPSDVGVRLEQEASTGQCVADLNFAPPSSATVQPGVYETLYASRTTPVNVDSYVDGLFDEYPELAPVYLEPLGIAYNTTLVDEPPQTWDDVLTGDFAGGVGTQDLTAPSATSLLVTLAMGAGAVDKAWLEQFLSETDTSLYARISDLHTAVVNGSSAVALGDKLSSVLESSAKGAPIDMVLTIDGVAYLTPVAAVTTKCAPSPAAAELFVNYLLTTDGQQELAGLGMLPVIEGVEGVDPSWPTWNEAAPYPSSLNYDSLTSLAAEILDR
ncbi:ABC transporter substrate-binding protein [Microbacterium sp. A94]|uniref:ABC transporter substrate-binding protein n=1 Tax=Microbacterium sp. A94 TaxID=3450717 RepID=UPI003F41EE6A